MNILNHPKISKDSGVGIPSFNIIASCVIFAYPLAKTGWGTLPKALNAHFMGCDAFEEGDLLVTFPGCKVPEQTTGQLTKHLNFATGTLELQKNLYKSF